jgi:hypothetical protein
LNSFFKVGDISEAWKRGDVHLIKANHYLSPEEASEIRAKPLPAKTTVFAKIRRVGVRRLTLDLLMTKGN